MFDPWVRKIPWRRKWQPTPVLLPGKSHGQRSLVGYSPWGRKELDTTERLHFTFTLLYEVNIQEEQDGKADGESCLQLLQNCPHMGPIVFLIFLGNQDALMGNSPSADLFS